MGELIAVLSGKGGTGKTSVCSGVAAALAKEGKRILCIDCDVGLRNLDISLGLSDNGTLSFLDVCSGAYSVSAAPRHPLYSSLQFLTAPMNCPIELLKALRNHTFITSSRSCEPTMRHHDLNTLLVAFEAPIEYASGDV